MSDISKSVIDKIEETNIEQKPKWEFVAPEAVKYTLLVMGTIIAGICLGIIFDLLIDLDLDILNLLGVNVFESVQKVVPIIMIAIFTAIIVSMYFDFRKTQLGYRYSTGIILIVIGVTIVTVGGISYITGISNSVDQELQSSIPSYKDLNPESIDIWNQPDKGLLTGKVIGVNVDNTFGLLDPNQHYWVVIIASEEASQQKNNLDEGKFVKVIGMKLSPEEFAAKDIRFWRTRYIETWWLKGYSSNDSKNLEITNLQLSY